MRRPLAGLMVIWLVLTTILMPISVLAQHETDDLTKSLDRKRSSLKSQGIPFTEVITTRPDVHWFIMTSSEGVSVLSIFYLDRALKEYRYPHSLNGAIRTKGIREVEAGHSRLKDGTRLGLISRDAKSDSLVVYEYYIDTAAGRIAREDFRLGSSIVSNAKFDSVLKFVLLNAGFVVAFLVLAWYQSTRGLAVNVERVRPAGGARQSVWVCSPCRRTFPHIEGQKIRHCTKCGKQLHLETN